MELPPYLIPLLCLLPLSPITWICLGWVILSVVVGVRGGAEAGFGLFLLGLGVLLVVVVVSAILFFLPDWLAVPLVSILALLPWLSVLRYFIASKSRGKLLLALPSKSEEWSTIILSGSASILLGLQSLILHTFSFYNLLTLAKSNTIGIFLISAGAFRILQKVRYPQIRETGILSETGGFYKWENIEKYGWKFGEDKLSLSLKKAFPKKNVNLKILSQFRREVVGYLAQNIRIEESNPKGYARIQKSG